MIKPPVQPQIRCLRLTSGWKYGIRSGSYLIGQGSLDDFGTGYSSLAYLKHFSLNKLKIDRSFVTELPHAVQDAAICKAIVVMSKSLSLRNVAEGIETASQAAALRQLGCQYGQGYYFSPALPVDQMTAFVSENQCEAQQAA